MYNWLGIALAVVSCGYGLYKIFRGRPDKSGDAGGRQSRLFSFFGGQKKSSDETTSESQRTLSASEQSGEESRAASSSSNIVLPAPDEEQPELIVPAVVDSPEDSSSRDVIPLEADFNERHQGSAVTIRDAPAAQQRNRGGLFADFDGILSSEADSVLTRPKPEELPMSEDDMVFGSVTPALAEMLPESESRSDSQRQHLAAAGYHSRAAWINLNAVRFVLAFLTLIIGGFSLLLAPPQMETVLLGFIVLGPVLMWALPPLVVTSKASERKIDIERGLPDVLDMLNMGVSQGLTVAASLRRISGEIGGVHPALSQELSIVNQQAEVGSLNHALRGFSNRIDSSEVASFTGLLTQSESTGTSIAQALKDYSDSMRASLRERADAQANAASFKLLFPTTLCLMPAVFLFLLGPAIVDLNNFFENSSSILGDGRADAVQFLDLQAVDGPANP
ncbi:MAG: type II secretion system F family protein [Fuerstiella sp.]